MLVMSNELVQGVSGEMSLFYFAITFFWKMILNFRLLENNELICPFYAYLKNFFFFLKIFSLGKRFSPGLGFEPALYEQKVRAIPLGYEGRSRPEILND